MKNKIILAIIIILLVIILIGVIYYVKNVMIVRDKDGMVYKSQKQITMNDETYDKGDD